MSSSIRLSSSIRRRLAPAAGATAVVAVLAATLVAHEVGHHASVTGPAGRPSDASSYLGQRDFTPTTIRGFIPTTSGGKVMVAP